MCSFITLAGLRVVSGEVPEGTESQGMREGGLGWDEGTAGVVWCVGAGSGAGAISESTLSQQE